MSYSESDFNFAINSLSIFSESESDHSESDFNSSFMNLDICIFFPYVYTILNKKFNRYIDLASVISTEQVKRYIFPPAIGALGIVSKQHETYIDVPNLVGSVKISTITSTARILKVSKIRI